MGGRVPYWRLSGFYFFYFSTLGGFLPYWGLYLQEQGFSAQHIGELMAMLAGTKIIAPNVWGWIADHTGRSMGIIRFASFLAALVFAGVFVDTGYAWLAAVTILFSFFWNAALPQFEAVTLAHLGADSHGYSQVRLWGSVGFIVAVVGFGSAIDVYSISLFPIVVTTLLAAIWLMSHTIPEKSVPHTEEMPARLREIFRDPGVSAFFVVFMLVQAAHGPYYAFFSIHLESNGYSGSGIGALWALGVCAEIALFIVMHRLLKRFALRAILLVSIFLGVLRWLAIAWAVTDVWLLIAAQMLHAATFGSSHVAAIHLVHRYFGARHQGKGQALYSSLSFGLGGMAGSLYSGHLWDAWGAGAVYSIAAVLSLLAFLIAWLWVGKDGRSRRVVYDAVVEDEA